MSPPRDFCPPPLLTRDLRAPRGPTAPHSFSTEPVEILTALACLPVGPSWLTLQRCSDAPCQTNSLSNVPRRRPKSPCIWSPLLSVHLLCPPHRVTGCDLPGEGISTFPKRLSLRGFGRADQASWSNWLAGGSPTSPSNAGIPLRAQTQRLCARGTWVRAKVAVRWGQGGARRSPQSC